MSAPWAIASLVAVAASDQGSSISTCRYQKLNTGSKTNLNVKPRSSVFRYKGKETNPQDIGKELNVQAILSGRVVQRGQDLSLFVELIDVALDKVVWSQQYNRKQADLVSLQTEIARDVSSRLKTKLSKADEAKVTKTYTTNPEAYQLYLKGNYYRTKYTDEGYKIRAGILSPGYRNRPELCARFCRDCRCIRNSIGLVFTSK